MNNFKCREFSPKNSEKRGGCYWKNNKGPGKHCYSRTASKGKSDFLRIHQVQVIIQHIMPFQLSQGARNVQRTCQMWPLLLSGNNRREAAAYRDDRQCIGSIFLFWNMARKNSCIFPNFFPDYIPLAFFLVSVHLIIFYSTIQLQIE